MQVVDPISQLLGKWSVEINIYTIILRISISIIISLIIGFERTSKNHAAGMRTYILVTVGACIAMMTGQYIFETFNVSDIARLAAQVVSGIGFLGAGTIMLTSKNQVRGLTTAAGLWACACVGLSIGIGFYTLSLVSGCVIFLCFRTFYILEKKLMKKSSNFAIHIELFNNESLRYLIEYLRSSGMKITRLDFNHSYSKSGLSVYSIHLFTLDKVKVIKKDYIDEIRKLPYVLYVEELS